MSRNIIRQLKALKHETVSPREAWLQSNRAVLLSQIKNTLPTEETHEARLEKLWSGMAIFLPRQMVYSVIRPIAVLVIVSLVASSTYSGTVKASYESVPGDWLYPAKRLSEKTQGAVISLLGDTNTETKFHVTLAQRRAEEVSQIIKNDAPNKATQVSAAVAELKNELATITDKLEGDTGVQAVVAKDVRQDTEAITQALQTVKNELLLSNGGEEGAHLAKEVAETKDLAKGVSVKAVEKLVTKHLSGDNSVTTDEVRQVVDAAITNVAVEAMESKQTVDGAQTIVDTVKTQVADLNAEAKKQSSLETSVANLELTKKVSDIVSQTKDAVIKAEAVSVEVDKKIVEAREAVISGDLTAAVGKIKEVTEVAKEAEKISETTIIKTQQVLPVVAVIKDSAITTASSTVGGVTSSLKDIFTIRTTTVGGATTTSATTSKTTPQ
jgi:hypothetical protein